MYHQVDPVKIHIIEQPEDIPESVKKFREIISIFKEDVLNRLDSPKLIGHKDAQTINQLKDATRHIIRFGNILMAILDNKHTSDEINDMFIKNDVDLSNMSYEQKEMCKYYIDIDIYTNTYSIKPRK